MQPLAARAKSQQIVIYILPMYYIMCRYFEDYDVGSDFPNVLRLPGRNC